jgi:hypothetical protein
VLEFLFPARSLATAREIPCLFCEGQPFIQFRHERAQRNQNGDRLVIASSGLDAFELALMNEDGRKTKRSRRRP